jgi:hypothetical protein
MLYLWSPALPRPQCWWWHCISQSFNLTNLHVFYTLNGGRGKLKIGGISFYVRAIYNNFCQDCDIAAFQLGVFHTCVYGRKSLNLSKFYISTNLNKHTLNYTDWITFYLFSYNFTGKIEKDLNFLRVWKTLNWKASFIQRRASVLLEKLPFLSLNIV